MPSSSTKKRSHKHSSSGSKSKKSKKSKEYISDSDGASTTKISESISGDDETEGEWVVEKVVGKRLRGGHVEYFIKWKDWPPSTNTWEPLSNLTNCPQLVEHYEDSISSENKKKQEVAGPNGFEKGWKAVAVRGVAPFDIHVGKEVFYLVEWEEREKLEKVSSTVVREKIPQKLIRYLQGKIRWKPPSHNIASSNNGHDNKEQKGVKHANISRKPSSSPGSSRKSSHGHDSDSSNDPKQSSKSDRRNGNGSSSGTSSGSDSS